MRLEHVIGGAAVVITLGVVVQVCAQEGATRKAQSRQLTEMADDKATVCAASRTSAAVILYALRDDDTVDSGVAQAQLLTTWMPYCAGERGTKLAREINDAVLVSIPRSKTGVPPSLDVERIRQALTAFRGEQ